MEQLLELEDPKQQVEAQAGSNEPAPMLTRDFEAKCFAQMEALREQGKRADLAAVFVRVRGVVLRESGCETPGSCGRSSSLI